MRAATSSQILAYPRDIDCSEDCKAEIVSSDSILSGASDSIVRVCKEFDQTCRFLVLHSGPNGWRLVDYLDSPYEKYEAPTVKVEASQDRRWLVKTAFAGGGTGVYLLDAEWYEFRCGSFHLILTLPMHGDDVNANPARFFSTRFRGYRRVNGRESLKFAYIVRFEDYPNQIELWQEERTVVFSRTGTDRPFAFDSAASGISEAFARKIFAFDSMDENDFLNFASGRLLTIARSQADSRRAWLRQFLADFPQNAKAESLKALFVSSTERK